MTQQIRRYQSSHHSNPAAVRTYPGRTITKTPAILFKTLITYLESAGTIPAKRQDLSTAMALIISPAPTPLGIGLLFVRIFHFTETVSLATGFIKTKTHLYGSICWLAVYKINNKEGI